MSDDVKRRSPPENWDRSGLPGWTYHSPALLDLEIEIFKTHWQVACHISDIPNAGDFKTFDLCGERAIILRDSNLGVRAFHNICRHRGSRLVATDQGTCKNALICPFHGWVYNLDGTLRGAAQPTSFPTLDKDEFALRTVEHEVWNGFVFVRFKEGPQPSVKELLGRYEEEAAGYNMAEQVPTDGFWTETSPVNWKSIRDVDNEGYHVAMAHPALQDLYGSNYYDESYVNGVSRSEGPFTQSKGRHWAVRNYKKFSKPREDLPEQSARTWVYYGIFPNSVIAVTPETSLFYQEFPTATDESVIRSATYRYPNEDRQQKAARYLASRIDRETVVEDKQLTIWSNESMASDAFDGFYLSDLEYGVRTYHDHLRAILPIYNVKEEPKESDVKEMNTSLIDADA
jgi:phenylpropionate dioxygenase-like ring-hydroxylating dioxygenase large terminal subunit